MLGALRLVRYFREDYRLGLPGNFHVNRLLNVPGAALPRASVAGEKRMRKKMTQV